jgi:putative flippase GtrA
MSPLRPFSRFGRFSLVGLVGATLQLLLISLFAKCLRMPMVAATPLAVELVLLHNFAWHERFTWRDRGFESLRQTAIRLCRFHAANGLISLLGNTGLLYSLVDRLNAPVLPSTIAAILVCSLPNFFLADRWVFSAPVRASSTHAPQRRIFSQPS